jgi:cytochrome c oxidase subunit IV
MEKDHSVHILPLSVYIRTYLVLLVGLVLTVVAAHVHIGPVNTSFFNNVVAMTIAVGKALIVVLFFMHVRYSSKLVWVWAGAGFVWFLLMFIMFFDYLTRIYLKGW